MLKYVSKHPAIAAERFRASLCLVWVIGRLLSGGVNVTGHAGTDTIYYSTQKKNRNQNLDGVR
jgi:hypothetical protein